MSIGAQTTSVANQDDHPVVNNETANEHCDSNEITQATSVQENEEITNVSIDNSTVTVNTSEMICQNDLFKEMITIARKGKRKNH